MLGERNCIGRGPMSVVTMFICVKINVVTGHRISVLTDLKTCNHQSHVFT